MYALFFLISASGILMRIKEKIAQLLKCLDFKSGSSKFISHFPLSEILPRAVTIYINLHKNLL